LTPEITPVSEHYLVAGDLSVINKQKQVKTYVLKNLG
jgi:hypothetical protein